MLQLLSIFFVATLIWAYVVRESFTDGSYPELIYKEVLTRKLDEIGVKVVSIQNVSGMRIFRQVHVFYVGFVTKRGKYINGYFYVGHRLFGLLCGHIRFKKHKA
jgi:hypothetical protein